MARAPAGAPPFWLIRTKTASFFSAAGARFFLTATISLWVPTALFVLAAAGKTAVALKTSARKTTAAMRTRRNMLQGYCDLSNGSLTEFPPGSMFEAVGIVAWASVHQ